MAEDTNIQTPAEQQSPQLEGGTYEIIRNRLSTQGKELRSRLNQLNESRKDTFGSIDFNLLGTDRITTENNCTAADIISIGDRCLFGYNVHMGLKKESSLSDVFSIFRYEDNRYHPEDLSLIGDEKFLEDFRNLYKYFRNTVFVKFAEIGPYLYMVFRIGKGLKDIKAFKWAIDGDTISYVNARSEHEVIYPEQYELKWVRAHRDMHRDGRHPHVSILDRVFVETIGGDLTIKVEDNTDTGKGIYAEEVSHKEQGLDDAEYLFADLGNIIILRIRPFQEKDYRYIAFNEKVQEARRIDALDRSCVLLPDDHGIIFSNGYYLQTGEFKQFEMAPQGMHFERRIISPNGEDYLYVFYNDADGVYVLLSYNLIAQTVENPIICHGFCLFENGELCYFKREEDPRKHHAIQIWQTPYTGPDYRIPVHEENFLYKIGNKDIVRAMAEATEILTLLNKDDSYANLYIDLVKRSRDLLDSYYWIAREETFAMNVPLLAIQASARNAIEEFEKVVQLRRTSKEEMQRVGKTTDELLQKVRRTVYDEVDLYVQALADLRTARGEVIALKELRYPDTERIEQLETEISAQSDHLSEACVNFLLQENALKPYQSKVEDIQREIEKVSKVAEAEIVETLIEGVGKELELLIEIVSNLKIHDATQTTRIIDNISGLYSELNSVRAALRKAKRELMSSEAVAEFNAQMKLLSQGMLNYLDISDSPQKTEEYLTKLMIQVEELEGKFSGFDEFTGQLADKREEIYTAFESKKVQLLERRNKRADSLHKSAERILKGIQNRMATFDNVKDINGYFASDLMIEKVRDIIDQLVGLEDSVKSEDIQSRLKTIREDAVRQLKDRKELFVDGQNVIRLGKHAFSVNTQNLDLTVINRDQELLYHLTGTNFFEKIEDQGILSTREVWEQELISENEEVYRCEYLAHAFLENLLDREDDALHQFRVADQEIQLKAVQGFMAPRYQEGYIKGVHDHDSLEIIKALAALHEDIGLLRFLPEERACAQMFWNQSLPTEKKALLDHRLKGAGYILKIFPNSREFADLINDISSLITAFCEDYGLFDASLADRAAEYLFLEIAVSDHFSISPDGSRFAEDFLAFLKEQSLTRSYEESLKQLEGEIDSRFELIRHWISAYNRQFPHPEAADHLSETVAILFEGNGKPDHKHIRQVSVSKKVQGLRGEHPVLQDSSYELNYNRFMHKLRQYHAVTVPAFTHFTQLKKELTAQFRHDLRLGEFKPRVLSSFVRNRLIDKVYLPLIGDNLAKQIGVVGEKKRTDLMGLLLLISPPGYGKTTLMEYIANRLGLIFMKINGPAIGHGVTSLDPTEAPNAAAREEMEKLNLAFEMGDNVMIYLDDIQHCHPEFLQKFISLCDAQRKIEGVWKGRSKTYDLRGKRVCVVMAGNPYTESGSRFQIPDMLSNRADTYNLGDIIGDTADVFKLSYIENSLTSNAILATVAQKSHKDIHTFLQIAKTDSREGMDLEGNYTTEEVNEIVSVLKKMIIVREVILKVNQEYIASAAQEDAYRTEPSFKLQGSYRDMNKISEKVIPIMNDEELRTLLRSHYENESQTLTSGAEANMLKLLEMVEWISTGEQSRWEEIKATFQKKQKLLGFDSGDRMTQIISTLSSLTEGLDGIKKALEK